VAPANWVPDGEDFVWIMDGSARAAVYKEDGTWRGLCWTAADGRARELQEHFTTPKAAMTAVEAGDARGLDSPWILPGGTAREGARQ
jgi:hypothetical protein